MTRTKPYRIPAVLSDLPAVLTDALREVAVLTRQCAAEHGRDPADVVVEAHTDVKAGDRVIWYTVRPPASHPADAWRPDERIEAWAEREVGA